VTLIAVFPLMAIISFDIGFLIADPVSLFAIILIGELIITTAFLNNIVYEPNNAVIVIADTQIIEEKSLAH